MTFKSKVKVTVTFSTPKKLIILQCLWLGPSNLVEMLVLTIRWSWGQTEGVNLHEISKPIFQGEKSKCLLKFILSMQRVKF